MTASHFLCLPRPLVGAIFDLDGVLVDSEPLHIRAWQELLGSFGVAAAAADFVRWIGVTDEKVAPLIVADYALPIGPEELLDRKRAGFRDLVSAELDAFPGLADRLARLGLPLAVATASREREAEHVLVSTGLRHHFRALVSGTHVTHPKPHPETYLAAAAVLGLPAAGCLAIEDSPTGIAAARAAGCFVVGVTSGHPADALAEADAIYRSTVDALDDLLAVEPV